MGFFLHKEARDKMRAILKKYLAQDIENWSNQDEQNVIELEERLYMLITLIARNEVKKVIEILKRTYNKRP